MRRRTSTKRMLSRGTLIRIRREGRFDGNSLAFVRLGKNRYFVHVSRGRRRPPPSMYITECPRRFPRQRNTCRSRNTKKPSKIPPNSISHRQCTHTRSTSLSVPSPAVVPSLPPTSLECPNSPESPNSPPTPTAKSVSSSVAPAPS